MFKDHLYLTITVIFFGLMNSGGCLADVDDPSILIDTKTFSLTVLSANNRPLARFRNISLGSGGVSDTHLAGDATTPLGTFHVAWINLGSRFGIFFGLDYPTLSHGAHALALGILDQADYEAILSAHHDGYLPPQDTVLGGQIGIHGIGEGSPEIQRHVNWTKGCIALPNADAVALGKWIHIGTKVIIR